MTVLETFVADIRAADKTPAAIREVLARTIAKGDDIRAQAPLAPGEETHLFEDNSVSIWHCCFAPHVAVPAHEHLMPVHIGVYDGVERNIILESTPTGLQPTGDLRVKAGDLVTLEHDCIHAVVGGGDQVSLALHVYMGPLTQVDRGLFDWDSGQRLPFTMEAFHRLSRPLQDLSLNGNTSEP